MVVNEGTLGGDNPSAQQSRDEVEIVTEPVVEPAKKTGGAPVRDYVVLEQVRFDGDEDVYYTLGGTVEARNSQNALRKAARGRDAFEGDEAKATIAVVPASMWRPTTVKLSRKSQVSVSIGG